VTAKTINLTRDQNIKTENGTNLILPKGFITWTRSVSLHPSATARQWRTLDGGILWLS